MPRLSTLGVVALAAWTSTGVQVRDIDGAWRRPFDPEGPASVLVFVSRDCPVSNGYAPEIQRTCAEFERKGVSCLLIYEDAAIEPAAVRAHLREYRYRGLPAVIDTGGALAARTKATVTPSVAVVGADGAIRYRGRIDNKYVATGKAREAVTSHDLRDAVDAVVAGRPVSHPDTEAFGCYISVRYPS